MSEPKTYRLQDSLPVPHPSALDIGRRRWSILVVEDEEDLNHALAFRLRSAGFHVLSAFDAATDLQRTGLHHPDLVLVDLAQPGRAGFASLREFLQLDRLRRLPVIALTEHDDEDTYREAERLGVLEVVAKPVDGRVVAERIRRVLGDPEERERHSA